MVNKDREEKYSRRKDKVLLPTGGSEWTNPEKIEDLCESILS